MPLFSGTTGYGGRVRRPKLEGEGPINKNHKAEYSDNILTIRPNIVIRYKVYYEQHTRAGRNAQLQINDV